MKLKAYPIYKDSGVPWLGEVPEDWDIRRLKYLLCERDVRSTNGTEQLLRVSQYTGVTERMRTDGVDAPDTRAESLVGYKKVRPDELVVNIMLAWNGSMGVSQYSGIVSPAYCVYAFAASSHPWYFHHLLRSPEYKTRFKAVSTGIVESRLRLYTDDLFRLETPVPPLVEQAAVVRFLDYMDRRIRRYIRAKQQLIRLLEKQKQAIIHKAVTRGLDPNVRLKPSNVKYLGHVPQHWEIMPLRRVTISRCDGPFGSGLKSSHYTDQGIRVVRLQNIGHAEFKDADAAFISPSHYTTLGHHTVEPGDLLIAGLGDEHHPAGRACVAPSFIVPAMVKADCFRFRLFRQRLDPEFAALHLTATAVDGSSFLSTGATRQRINLQAMSSRSVAVPPTNEQLAIVQHITNETSLLRLVISNADREIALIREYRTRLISDVVTGKLDVRGVELPTGNETAGLEDFDDSEDMPPLTDEIDEVESIEEEDVD